MKRIEIYYRIADIPGITDRSAFSTQALMFRNAARHYIEKVMTFADAGEWQIAEIGADAVNIGFDVPDAERAEQVLMAAVAGTRFEKISRIAKRSYDDAAFDEDFASVVPAVLQGQSVRLSPH